MKISQKHVYIVLLLITFLGFGLRLYALTWEQVWYDEAVSVSNAKSSLMELAALSKAEDTANFPPVYYLILKGWVALFGDSAKSIRMPSVLFGTASILVLFFIGQALWDEKHGLLAALLMAISPFDIYYSQEARVYAFQVLVITLATYFLIAFLIQQKKRLGWAYIVTIVLAVYAHFFSIFIFTTLVAFHVVYLWYKDRTLSIFGKRIWIQWIALLGLMPLVVFKIQHHTKELIKWVPPFKLSEYRHTLMHFLFGVEQNQSGWMYKSGVILFILCAIISAGYLIKNSKKGIIEGRMNTFYAGVLVWMLFLIPILQFTAVSITIHPIYVSWRYLIIALPGFLLLLTYSLLLLPGRVTQIGGILLLSALCLISDKRNYKSQFKIGMQSIAQFIQQEERPDDILFFVPPYQVEAFCYYYRGHIPINTNNVDRNWVSSLKEKYSAGDRVWLVIDDKTPLSKEDTFLEAFVPDILGTPIQMSIIPPFNTKVYLFQAKDPKTTRLASTQLQ